MLAAYKTVAKEASENELLFINHRISLDWMKLLSPLAPHLAEELLDERGEKPFFSDVNRDTIFICECKWPDSDESLINPTEEFKHELMEHVIDDVENVLELSKIRSPTKILLIVSPSWKYQLFSMVKTLLKTTFDQKTITTELLKTDLKKHGEEIAKIVPALLKDPSKLPEIMLDQHAELDTLRSIGDLLKRTFSSNIIIKTAEQSTEKKKAVALPGRPAIVVT